MANHGGDEAALGLHLAKFVVTREDGAHLPGERHEGCRSFPLDIDHDPHAIPAVTAYANSCRLNQPLLAAELMPQQTRSDDGYQDTSCPRRDCPGPRRPPGPSRQSRARPHRPLEIRAAAGLWDLDASRLRSEWRKNVVMLTLSAPEIVSLPVDDLALRIVRDFAQSGGWNQHNYILEHQQNARLSGDALSAVAEALEWARSHGLLARSPGQSSSDAIFVTRAGQEAIRDGLVQVRAAVRLSSGLHPLIERRGRPQFLLGELEQAVFVSMKAVEIRVRQLAGFGDDQFGVDMMNRAFGPTGPLTDPDASKGEKDGTRAMFGGAYAVLRNPSGHRDVDYSDPAEAAESVVTASLLMRILDRVEARLSR